MSLSFGWKFNDERESIWKDDPALGEVPPSVIEAWKVDGDASHLRPYVKPGATPTIIKFRALTFTEKSFMFSRGEGEMFITCFRIGTTFVGAQEDWTNPSTGQAGFKTYERVGSVRMLSDGFCGYLDYHYPAMASFYAGLIWRGTIPSEPEKKASLPQPTPTPSLVVESTTGNTAATVEADAAGA